MTQIYRALASLTFAAGLLVVPDHAFAQRSRSHAFSTGSEALTTAGKRHVTEHHFALVTSASLVRSDMLDSVRRQPRDLLNGINLGRAERKAVNGIVRKNGRHLRMLEAQHRSAAATPAMQRNVEREIAALRDRERAELRAVLSPAHQHLFDRNLAQIASNGF
jgi:hypothetical protein